MNTKIEVCPFCQHALEEGKLKTGVDVGIINFFIGVSGGTKAKLYWSKDKLFASAIPIPYKKSHGAFRCNECGAIIFKP
jgi:hypothetical protein